MPDFTKPAVLSEGIKAALGERGPKEATKAIAYWEPTGTFWVAKQNGYVTDEEIDKLAVIFGTKNIYNAWPNKCKTKLAAATGFHAEMIIVSAHISWKLGCDNNKLSAAQIEWSKLSVAANCDCCIHCQLAMKDLKINHLASSYGESNTAWWSPITDVAIPKADPQFSKGLSLLYASATQSTY